MLLSGTDEPVMSYEVVMQLEGMRYRDAKTEFSFFSLLVMIVNLLSAFLPLSVFR